MSVLFFTCANADYEDFVPLYAFCVMTHVEDSSVEIGVEDLDSFSSRHGRAVEFVRNIFGNDRLKIRNVPWRTPDGRRLLPNSVRFINEPVSRAEYVYIGDIDIIILERRFMSRHLMDMESTGLPYSNSVRPSTKRMSGLHFARMETHYPLPEIGDIDACSTNDEALLYEIIKRKNQPIIDDRWFRPTHGIHISPNRPVEKRKDESGRLIPGWGIEPHKKAWIQLNNSSEFQQLRALLSPRVRGFLTMIDEIAERKSGDKKHFELGRL